MFDFLFLAQQCAPDVHPDTLRRIVQVESSFNLYAIGVVGGHLQRQPRNREEAIATAQWLERNGYNYSVGLAQVNKTHFSRYGLTLATAFEACPNLWVGGQILTDCFVRANHARSDEQAALRDALSCYYSGNFITGYQRGYVRKVVADGAAVPLPMPRVPDIASKKNSVKKNSAATSRLDSAREEGTTPLGSALLF